MGLRVAHGGRRLRPAGGSPVPPSVPSSDAPFSAPSSAEGLVRGRRPRGEPQLLLFSGTLCRRPPEGPTLEKEARGLPGGAGAGLRALNAAACVRVPARELPRPPKKAARLSLGAGPVVAELGQTRPSRAEAVHARPPDPAASANGPRSDWPPRLLGGRGGPQGSHPSLMRIRGACSLLPLPDSSAPTPSPSWDSGSHARNPQESLSLGS